MGPPKKSGAMNNKIRKRKLEDNDKLSKQMKLFLSKSLEGNTSRTELSNDLPLINSLHPEDSQAQEDHVDFSINVGNDLSKQTSTNKDNVSVVSDFINSIPSTSSDNNSENIVQKPLHFNDPSSRPYINDKIRTLLIEHGPEQGKNSDFSYSENFEQRKFSADWFFKTLPNGDKIERNWLIGSSNDITKSNCGIFLNLIELISSYNPIIAQHLSNSNRRTTYLSNKVQNEFICLLGQGLAEEILKKLSEDGLEFKNCRGQGYDNGANMAGKIKGVQSRLQEINKHAQFCPCTAHSLNLVGAHASRVSVRMVTFFGTVQSIFNFFSSSTARWNIVSQFLKCTLKSHSDTRWESKYNAVHSLLTQLKYVIQALQHISENSEFGDGVSGAQSLLGLINVEFVYLLVMWLNFKSTLSNITNDFEFLSGFHLNTLSIEDLKKHAADLVLKYSSDLNSELLNEIECFKYQGEAIIPNLKMATYLDILNGIKTYELSSVYPNLVIAYRLLLTFPVTVASGERSFSKLKLIKTYLRSTMTQERLSNLAILSIENKITQTINFDDVIENFASIKSRKISL
ncbi:uncharacterized protein LOC132925540 [Rhopalosiphum padi]|uniref:uncharacterized protein LOC132925540 n=1 Tax=Rhopalosiphum padi TaxID=40932 RepID=UPI00298D6EDE|nr:uncharacterized protein LOC132925540 [Rhopalosiphum padi]